MKSTDEAARMSQIITNKHFRFCAINRIIIDLRKWKVLNQQAISERL